ncbi:MAG: hypothetical protein J6W51_04125 [Fibrobacter sp.]|nr:hypothetical protein [Fibrobacter sp.]
MFNISKQTKYYVHCPAGVVTGGVELLHQLVDFLRNSGKNAYIVYSGEKEHSVPADYKSYNIEISESIENDPSNIEIFNESEVANLFDHGKTQKFLWWLSVDFFFLISRGEISLVDHFHWNKIIFLRQLCWHFYQLIKNRFKIKKKISTRKIISSGILCGYQSEYIHSFLLSRKFERIVPLTDYINTEYFSKNSLPPKENIILYNPKKGMDFTKKIIAAAPELRWIPIQNMTRIEVIQLMQRSKVYIDFGNHPGKDRLPREAAINKCCIITGKRGAASFFEDVPIPQEYKFDDKTNNIPKIAATIKKVFLNYETEINKFNYYRNQIKKERFLFEQQASNIFLDH